MRVHSGEGLIEWDGHQWRGIGEVLKENFTLRQSGLSSRSVRLGKTYEPPYFTASLPLGKETNEVISRGHYRERCMEMHLCDLDDEGNVLEMIVSLPGAITEYSVRGNVFTFRGEADFLLGVEERDGWHKENVEAVRQQFKWDFPGAGTLGVSMNAIGALMGNWLGLVLDCLLCASPKKRQFLVQRWQARKRVYWFETQPPLPGVRRWKKGYRFRADTLYEAKMMLCRKAARRVWKFHRGVLQLLVYQDRGPAWMLNLDEVRQRDDPQRWADTNPVREWLKST